MHGTKVRIYLIYLDQQRINTQTDRNGQVWHFDPRQEHAGWTRTARAAHPGDDRLHGGYAICTPERTLAAELSYKASSMAVQLALADPHKPIREIVL